MARVKCLCTPKLLQSHAPVTASMRAAAAISSGVSNRTSGFSSATHAHVHEPTGCFMLPGFARHAGPAAQRWDSSDSG